MFGTYVLICTRFVSSFSANDMSAGFIIYSRILLCSILLGEYPTIQDWENHLSTAFPEVRLKKFLEMRGADGGPWKMICALPALWVGLLYDRQAQSEALDLIEGWSQADRDYLQEEVGAKQ